MSEDTQRPARVVPDPDGLNADFYEHAAQGQLRFQRCSSCGTWRHPPRYLCAKCGSDRHEWGLSSGRGRVFSWTVTHRPIDPGWAHEMPYATIVVQMEEGVRVVGALKDVAPADLRLDLPVVAELEPVSEQFAFIWFRPV